MDSFDDDDSADGQALAVESEDDDFDLDIPPTTGNEYLRRVRMEANTCPRVVVADIDTKFFQNRQTVHVKQWVGDYQAAPQGFAPNLAWQNTQLANFAEQRQKLARYKAKRKTLKITKLPSVPPANDVQAWCRLCFGRLKPPARSGAPGATTGAQQAAAEEKKFPKHEGILPLVSVMVAMDQPTVIKVLEYHLNWFEATGFTEKQGYWLYALLACLEKPLSPDACSLIRRLARSCSRLRASMDSIEDPRLIPMNLLICLVARYFDQGDLKDDVT